MYNSYNDYKMVDTKLEFSDRMKLVQENVKARLKPRDPREGTHTSPVGTNGKDPMFDAFNENPDAPYVLCLANGIVRTWLETPCVIFPNEAVVGITRPMYPLLEHFCIGIQRHGSNPEHEKELDEMAKRIRPRNWDYLDAKGQEYLGAEKYGVISGEDMYWAGGYQGHTIPNYVTLLENGLDGMLRKIDYWANINAKTQDQLDFYEANRIIVRGMMAHLEQYSAYAQELYEKESDPMQKRYYKEISQNCAFVAHNKPETLYQAVQLMWILSLWDWVDCLGRVDQYLYKFYERSVTEGDVIPVEDSIASIMFKIWENGAHNTTLSGCIPENGEDATNDLSYLFLQTLRNIHDTHPRMVVRIGENIPKTLLDLMVKIWSEGMCDPTIVSDTLVIPALQRIEVPLNDARDYATLGCQEIEIPGKSNTGCEDGSFNVAKVFEFAMDGGKSRREAGYQLGPVTKPFLECETFEEFYDGFAKQLEYFTEVHCWLCSRGQEIRAANHSKLVKGVFTDGVLESGKNHDDGGPIYGYGVIETAGIAAVADSMTAIKKLVFDEKVLTKEQLVEALNANFEGYEKIRQMLLNSAPKFGNDNDEADSMAMRVLNTYWDEVGKYRSVRGGLYTGACSLLDGGISYGESMDAMPDGRFKGEPLGNTMGPRPGADTSGVTAMLASVAKLPLHKGVGGTTLNVIFTTKMLSTPELREDIVSLVKNFMATGGQMAQINTANLEDLKDAKIHPERHGDLIVRVGGFSIQFVQLESEIQDEIISRYTA